MPRPIKFYAKVEGEDNAINQRCKKAKTRKGFSENVKREMEAGKPQKQALAIAYSQAGEKKGKKRG